MLWPRENALDSVVQEALETHKKVHFTRKTQSYKNQTRYIHLYEEDPLLQKELVQEKNHLRKKDQQLVQEKPTCTRKPNLYKKDQLVQEKTYLHKKIQLVQERPT